MNVTKNFYREELIEHYQAPQNFGVLKSFDVSSKQLNPFCGDEIEMFIKLDQNRNSLGANRIPPSRWKIKEIGFLGKGCVISIATGSFLTEYAKGRTKVELTKFSEKDMLSLLGIELSETRKKCALLALSVLKDCL